VQPLPNTVEERGADSNLKRDPAVQRGHQVGVVAEEWILRNYGLPSPPGRRGLQEQANRTAAASLLRAVIQQFDLGAEEGGAE